MRLLPTISLLWLAASSCISFSPQTRHITQTWYTDPAPEVSFDTPGLSKKHGFMKYDELIAYLERVQAQDETITVESIGQSQRGRAIPLVRVPATEQARIRVWLQGGLHGDEPGTSEAMLALLDRLSSGDLAEIRRFAEIAVVPMVNPDGYQVQSRYAANGLDLNRDQTKLNVPETTLIRQAFVSFDPQVALDFHEYRPYRRDFVWLGENGTTGKYDVMFLYSGNLNVPEPLRSLTDDVFVEAARQTMDEHGLTHHPYVTTRDVAGDVQFSQGSSNARSSATSYALSHTVSTLVEVRGVGLRRDGFERRVKTAVWVAESFLRTAVEQAETVHQVLADAQAPERVTVTSVADVAPGELQMIDLMRREAIDVPVLIHDNLQSRAVLSRARPSAYVLLPEATPIVERLEVLGIAVERLTEPTVATVERYRVSGYQRDSLKYEGVHRQRVITDVDAVEMTLPAGSYRVPMDQPRSNLAAEILEPEAPNSFVSFGVLETELGAELPIYRRPVPATSPTAP